MNNAETNSKYQLKTIISQLYSNMRWLGIMFYIYIYNVGEILFIIIIINIIYNDLKLVKTILYTGAYKKNIISCKSFFL